MWLRWFWVYVLFGCLALFKVLFVACCVDCYVGYLFVYLCWVLLFYFDCCWFYCD